MGPLKNFSGCLLSFCGIITPTDSADMFKVWVVFLARLCFSHFQYAVIIGILVLLEIGAVVVAYFFYDEVETIITTGLALALNSTYDSKFVVQAGDASTYDYTPGGLISKGIDAIQAEVRCFLWCFAKKAICWVTILFTSVYDHRSHPWPQIQIIFLCYKYRMILIQPFLFFSFRVAEWTTTLIIITMLTQSPAVPQLLMS